MNVYFSGIGGVGLGPLAMIAQDAGYSVHGSERNKSLITAQLESRSIAISDDQSGSSLRRLHSQEPIDWLVYTAALPEDHPELQAAHELGIRITKRDELLVHILDERKLKLIAVSGTHGKTSATGMVVWLAKYFSIPISYSLGTTTSWCPSGLLHPRSEYFVYECDEFDKNFLKFHPFVSIITSIEYDHPDTYPTEQSYYDAFSQFIDQSKQTIAWKHDVEVLADTDNSVMSIVTESSPLLTLPGAHNRRNASLILQALEAFKLPAKYAADGLNKFPGTHRRFECLAANIYTDYGHTPSEIKATLQMAKELSNKVILVYQPHQNRRQHAIKNEYRDDIFQDADEVLWLPTYLSREDDSLAVLTPKDLTQNLSKTKFQTLELGNSLAKEIENSRSDSLILCMSAGDLDSWLRNIY